jgi:hypothetical protein
VLGALCVKAGGKMKPQIDTPDFLVHIDHDHPPDRQLAVFNKNAKLKL